MLLEAVPVVAGGDEAGHTKPSLSLPSSLPFCNPHFHVVYQEKKTRELLLRLYICNLFSYYSLAVVHLQKINLATVTFFGFSFL